MKDSKIDFTPTYRSTQVSNKNKPEGKKQVASSRWQEVEEKRDPSKSGVVNNLKKSKKERFLTLKERQSARKDDKEQSPFEMFSSVHAKQNKEKHPDSGSDNESEFLKGDIELDSDIDEDNQGRIGGDIPVLEKRHPTQGSPSNTPVLVAAPCQIETMLDKSYAAPASSISGSSFQNIKLLQFVDKLVKKITVMKTSGKTEITLTLKNLSLFNGGILKVVEHDSARGQYNIIFSNLNQKAHALVTSPYAERLLKQALEPKGFTCHIISASTEIEPVKTFALSSRDHGSGSMNEEEDERESESHT